MFKSIYKDIKSQFDYGNNINRLIIVNAIVFVAVLLVKVVIALSVGPPNYVEVQQKFVHIFTLPPELLTIIKRPWTIISHMFLHVDFFHFFFNMLILYWFGRIFGDLMGDRRVIPLYILGGLMGIVFIQLGAVFGIAMAPALGASAAIMAIVIATAIVAPDYTLNLILLGPVKLKFIVLALIVMDLAGIANMNNTGGHFGHIGGMVMGWLYVLMVQSGNDPANWMNKSYDTVRDWFRPKPPKKSKSPLSVKYKATVPRSKSSTRKSTMIVSSQDKLDSILEKISKKGIESLSDEERAFLDQASKNK